MAGASTAGRPLQDAPRAVSSGDARLVTAPGLPFVPTNCQGTTRGGEACTAPPTKGSFFCVGHQKQMAKKVKDGNP